MTSARPPEELLSAARRYASVLADSNNVLPSHPSWDDLKQLVRSPYLFCTEQVLAFIALLDCAPELLPFVSTISLEDRSLTIDAYTPEWPLQTLSERNTWGNLCKYISLLSSKHDLRNLSLAVTACKRIQEDFHMGNGEHVTEPAKIWTEPIILDCLALSGCDLQQPSLLRYFRPKETIIYTAGPAWRSTGLETMMYRTTSPTLDIVVGSFPPDGAKVVLIETMIALQDREQPLNRVTFRVRNHRSQRPDLENVVAKVVKAGIVDYDMQVKPWQPRGTTQLEAERAEWADGAWLNRDPTGTKPSHEDNSDVDKEDEWDNCADPDPILREIIPDDAGDELRARIEAVLAD